MADSTVTGVIQKIHSCRTIQDFQSLLITANSSGRDCVNPIFIQTHVYQSLKLQLRRVIHSNLNFSIRASAISGGNFYVRFPCDCISKFHSTDVANFLRRYPEILPGQCGGFILHDPHFRLYKRNGARLPQGPQIIHFHKINHTENLRSIPAPPKALEEFAVKPSIGFSVDLPKVVDTIAPLGAFSEEKQHPSSEGSLENILSFPSKIGTETLYLPAEKDLIPKISQKSLKSVPKEKSKKRPRRIPVRFRNEQQYSSSRLEEETEEYIEVSPDTQDPAFFEQEYPCDLDSLSTLAIYQMNIKESYELILLLREENNRLNTLYEQEKQKVQILLNQIAGKSQQ